MINIDTFLKIKYIFNISNTIILFIVLNLISPNGKICRLVVYH